MLPQNWIFSIKSILTEFGTRGQKPSVDFPIRKAAFAVEENRKSLGFSFFVLFLVLFVLFSFWGFHGFIFSFPYFFRAVGVCK